MFQRDPIVEPGKSIVYANANVGNGVATLISKPSTVNPNFTNFVWALTAFWWQAAAGNTSSGLNILIQNSSGLAGFRFTGIEVPGRLYELLPTPIPIGVFGTMAGGITPITEDDVAVNVTGMTAGTVRVRVLLSLIPAGNYLTGL